MDLNQEITDCRPVQDHQQVKESLVEVLLRLNDIAEQPVQLITNFALQKAIELTRSRSGCLTLLNEDETAATMYSWPSAATERDREEVAATDHSLAEGGRWAEAVRCRCPVIANEEIPPGRLAAGPPHALSIQRNMDVPVFDGDKIVAVAGVGSKDAPYDESDIRQLKLLTIGLWRLLQRKHAEDRLRATAEALQRSEAYLEQAQRLTHTGSWVDDGTMRPVYWSEEHYRIFGLDPQRGIPTREEALERIHPDDRIKVKQAFERAVRDSVDSEAEYRLVHPDGTVKYAQSIGHPVLDSNGNLVEIVGTTVDITERKRNAEALALTSFALNNAHDAAALLDFHGRILYVNDEACRHTGYTRDELATMSVWDVNPEFTAEKWSEHWQTLKTAQSVTFESYHVRKNGQTFPVEISARYLEYEGTVFNVAIVRDITERKAAEEALKRSESYLAEAQRLTHTGSWADNGAPVYWSEEHYRIFGLDPQQGLPSREQVLERIHPDDQAMVHQAFATVTHAKTDCEALYRIVMPDGTVRWAHGIGHPVVADNGIVIEMVGTTVDVTERKRAEEERAKLHQLEADLAHINRVSMMGELTASIAHEVNQPLSGVVSNGSACLRWLAGDTPNLEEGREAARRIVRDGKRAAEIIGRIRALTKRATEHREKLDLDETIRQVLPLVGDESKKRGVTIETYCSHEFVPVVMGDRVQLQQVMLNLVMNGLEAMSTITDHPRQLMITSRNVDECEVEVTIQDTGVGLDPKQGTRIFDAFYTTKPTGMGMGLSICRSIVTAHGGRLWATGNTGPGTTFHFTLPLELAEGNADGARV